MLRLKSSVIILLALLSTVAFAWAAKSVSKTGNASAATPAATSKTAVEANDESAEVDQDVEIPSRPSKGMKIRWGTLTPAQTTANSTLDRMLELPKKTKKRRMSLLLAPLASYKDTYGFIGGLAVVVYVPKTQTRLTTSVNTNFDGYFKYRERFEWIIPKSFIFDADGYLGNDLQTYYGEGDQTPKKGKKAKGRLNGGKITALRHVYGDIYSGFSAEFRNRHWTTANLNPVVFRNEDDWRLGFQNRWEHRDNIVNPKRGQFVEVDAFALPDATKNGAGLDVLQLEGDFRNYTPLPLKSSLASRFYTGNSWGNPSYSYRRALGGSGILRGFKSNRYRGKRFYVIQNEVRIPALKWFGVDAGIDVGDAGDGRLEHPAISYQAGFRTTLLAKFGFVIRADWGWSKDMKNFFFATWEPF